MYDVENMQQMIQIYGGFTMFLPAFLICVIYAFCSGKEPGQKRLTFVFLLSILFIFNDVSMGLVGRITGIATYYRFLWAVPILPMIAWAGTKVVTEREKHWERVMVLGLLACLFWGSKNSFVVEGTVRIPENAYNLAEDVIQVCEMIEKDKDKERPVVIFDLGCQMQSRLYDPSLIWGISRKAYQTHNNTAGYENVKKYKAEKAMIRAVNYGIKGEEERLSKALKNKRVDYIVTLTLYEMNDYLEQVGYELLGTTLDRSVYVRKGE